jgi:hypothetical protein
MNTLEHDTVRHDTSWHERLAVPYRLLGPCTTRTSLSRVVPALLAQQHRKHGVLVLARGRGAKLERKLEREEQIESCKDLHHKSQIIKTHTHKSKRNKNLGP